MSEKWVMVVVDEKGNTWGAEIPENDTATWDRVRKPVRSLQKKGKNVRHFVVKTESWESLVNEVAGWDTYSK